MVESVIVSLSEWDQDHSFYLVLIELSSEDWKGKLVGICTVYLYLRGLVFPHREGGVVAFQ